MQLFPKKTSNDLSSVASAKGETETKPALSSVASAKEENNFSGTEKMVLNMFSGSGLLKGFIGKIFTPKTFRAMAEGMRKKFAAFELHSDELFPVYTLRISGDTVKVAIVTFKEVMIPVEFEVQEDIDSFGIITHKAIGKKWRKELLFSRTLQEMEPGEFINSLLPDKM